jgi:hypothetical protein
MTTTDAFTHVESALIGLAAALRTGSPEAVLAAEAPLELAVRRLNDLVRGDRLDPISVWQGTQAIRQALGAVRLMGAASAALEAIVCHPATYGAPSRPPYAEAASSTRAQRV